MLRGWKETRVQAVIGDSALTRKSLSRQGEGTLISEGTVFSSLTRFPPPTQLQSVTSFTELCGGHRLGRRKFEQGPKEKADQEIRGKMSQFLSGAQLKLKWNVTGESFSLLYNFRICGGFVSVLGGWGVIMESLHPING